ncbi:TRAFAC clade GTPase domain-containing protein [Butyrivibrio sp. AE2032]|uniref:TRAFAC clade GTPase domain-containing protein n=1 Tax=Butyrivibrio sp. AE2032 TaxID=1458463 RepID=UPI0005575595|nr:hypothetical protein [Butyrivibrio sp. AE2032]
MPDKKITCPFCFNSFNDQDVHFRMETVFKDEELDPEGEARTKEDLEGIILTTNDEEIIQRTRSVIEQYEFRAHFQAGPDQTYEDFWRNFGPGTTEESFDAVDGRTKSIKPYHRPVYSISKKEHNAFFSKVADKKTIIEDDLVVGATDCFGNQTKRRVCPYCHNPLPGKSYGRYPVLFIPIIGVTGSGKTVYLSQVCKYITRSLARYSISCNTTSQYAAQYVSRFPVKIGSQLPRPTAPEVLLQPLCFDVAYRDNNDIVHNHTLVFYDIAGENCVNPEKLDRWGKFILHADAIILVIDPIQFTMGTEADEPSQVLNTIYNTLGADKLTKIPFAVCVSKGDKAAKHILGTELTDIVEVKDSLGVPLPKFNADDYNAVNDKMSEFVRVTDGVLHNELQTHYNNYNYFLFSALGCDVEKKGEGVFEPVAIPVPRRIMEPLLWILEEYRYITAEGIIHEPTDWFCPVCKQRLKHEVKYCPKCHVNAGQSKCYCFRCNVEYEYNKDGKNYCPKCKRDSDGKKKSIFSF